MIRELPKVVFGETAFFVDLRLNEFRQVDMPFNNISFENLMDNEDGYVLCFDPQTKNAFNGSMDEFHTRKEELLLLQVPHFMELDPIGFEQRLDRMHEQVKENIRNRGR